MYGARPLKRAIQRYVESPLSKRLLAGEFPEGSAIVVDSVDGEIVFGLGDTGDEEASVVVDSLSESDKETVAT
jgi:hypothetical protein